MRSILFEFFGIPVYSYGVAMAAAFGFAVWHIRRLAMREGMKGEGVVDAAIVAMISGVVGARLFHVFQPEEWKTHYSQAPLDMFKIWEGGLTFYGGLIACFITVPLVFRKHKMPFWPVADCFAPSLAMGGGLARLGCLMNGCCYGKPATWGLVMPEVDAVARQPSQLYEAAACFALFFLLLHIHPRRRFHGQTLLVYLLGYAAARFVIEFTRGDEQRGGLGPLSTSQWVALGITAVSLALWPWLARTRPREAPATDAK